jgi:long-chain acyl-CoA synthetase
VRHAAHAAHASEPGAHAPGEPQSLHEVLAAFLARGSAPALRAYAVDGSARALDYAALAGAVAIAAERWRALGAGPAMRALLCAPPGLDWVVAALGALHAGAAIVPLDPQAGAELLAHALATSEARAGYVDVEGDARTAALAPLLRYLPHAAMPPRAADGPVPRGGGDEAVLFYTSGTTGTPKGVPLTHANLCFQVRALGARGIVRAGDRVLTPLPLHHVYPFTVGLLVPLALGLTVILPAGLGGPELRHALHDGEATVLLGVPRLYRALLDALDGRLAAAPGPARALMGAPLRRAERGGAGAGLARRALGPLRRAVGPRLRLLACGGAPLDAPLHARLLALGFEVGVGYGLTETAPLLTLNLGECGPGSTGRALDGIALRIAPAPLPEELPPAAPVARSGEVQARGPGVFGGYLADHAPQDAFTDDGWFRTGDLGYQDARGCLFLLGRAGTLVMTASGKKFDPEPAEARYQTHPAIAEAGLLADDGAVAAVIVAARDAGRGDSRAAAVRAALREQGAALPSYQRIERYVLSDAPLARTPLGKLRRGELAARYRALRGEAPAAAGGASSMPEHLLRDARARTAWEVLGARFPGQPLAAHTDLRLDLGVDSIGWVALTLALEERGIYLPESALETVHTVEDFLAAVSRESGTGSGNDPALPRLDAAALATLRGTPTWTHPLRALLYATAAGAARTLWRLRVEAQAPLPEGACVIAPNHASYLDAPALAVALGWRALGRTRFTGWAGVMGASAAMRALSRIAGVLVMDPEHRPAAAFAAAGAALDAGYRLVWFPEGRRSPDGRLQPLRPGMSLLLARHPVPVVPVWIAGAHAALPPGARLPRLVPITVRIGAPLPAAAPGTPVEEISAAVERALRTLAR